MCFCVNLYRGVTGLCGQCVRRSAIAPSTNTLAALSDEEILAFAKTLHYYYTWFLYWLFLE